jgi:hypothetical protein
MPKFYFNLSGATPVEDEGAELPSVVAAMELALQVADELGRNKHGADPPLKHRRYAPSAQFNDWVVSELGTPLTT